jgi:hypothetical protein
MRKNILVCVAVLALLSAASPTASLAQGGAGESRRAEVLARLQDAKAKARRVEIKFKSGALIVGKVGELRERGFTFEPDGLSEELRRQNAAAVILYEELSSVQYPSKVRRFFKKVGYGLAVGGAYALIMPLNGVAILLGGSSIPGCP